MNTPETSRSYRRLQKNLVKAAANRERKLELGKLSLESSEGKLVIVVSSHAPFPDRLDHKKTKEDHEARLAEAEKISRERSGQYGGIVIRPKAYIPDIQIDFMDREVSDICMIGHGSINGFMTDSEGEYFTWQHAARTASRLKQGKIEQRTCARFPSELSCPVAVGTFAVANIENVYAAVGEIVPLPEEGVSREHLFRPVYNGQEHVLDQIQHLNNQHHRQPLQDVA